MKKDSLIAHLDAEKHVSEKLRIEAATISNEIKVQAGIFADVTASKNEFFVFYETEKAARIAAESETKLQAGALAEIVTAKQELSGFMKPRRLPGFPQKRILLYCLKSLKQ